MKFGELELGKCFFRINSGDYTQYVLYQKTSTTEATGAGAINSNHPGYDAITLRSHQEETIKVRGDEEVRLNWSAN
jgi:hypothetical protein